MSLGRALARGTCGVRWRPGRDLQQVEDGEHEALWRAADGCMVRALRSPLPFGLDGDDALDPVLRADLEASARAAFVAHWAARPPAERGRCRTDDASWSPVIEARGLALCGGAALRVIRRVAYAPGDELVVGHVVVPVVDGHVDLQLLAGARTTGMRESLLLETRMRMGQPLPADGGALAQAELDRPDADARFPQHPLSIVRRRLDALIGAGELAVPHPAPPPPRESRLEPAGCTIVAPPRFRLVPPGVLRLSPTLCTFARPGLDGWLRLFEVWRLDERIASGDRHARLEALAAATIAGWEREGARDLATRARRLDAARPTVEQEVRFEVGGGARLGVYRWFVDDDGVVFRLGAAGGGGEDVEALRAEVTAAAPTWRRLDPRGLAPATTAARPWWKRW